MEETAIIEFINMEKQYRRELEIPLDVSANDIVTAIGEVFQLSLPKDNENRGYLIAENPIAFLHGTRTLREYGIHNGSFLIYQGENR